MWRHFYALIGLTLLVCLSASAQDQYARFNGSCQQGGGHVKTNGINSTEYVQISYPACTVTVYVHGGLVKPPLFTDAPGTLPLPNPFTATSKGAIAFYAANGRYDVQLSGAGIPTPFTIPDIELCFNCTGGGGGGGLADPGANGPISRIAPNVTAPATAADIVGLFIGGAVCDMTTFLRGDGQCQTPAGGGNFITGATTGYGLAQTGTTLGLAACPAGQVQQSIGAGYQCATVSGGGGGGGNVNTIGTPVAPQAAIFTDATHIKGQTKAIYDTRDYATCDSTTDSTSGFSALLTAIGTQNATIHVVGSSTPTAHCKLENFIIPANVTLDFSGGGAIEMISSTTVPGGAAFVQGTSVECGSATTCAAPAQTYTAGNALVVLNPIYPGFTYKTTSVTDTCGDIFYKVQQTLVNQPRNESAWVASNIAGGSCAVTIHANGTLTNSQVIVQEFSGMGPVVSPDGRGSDNHSTTTTMSSGAATTTAGSLLIGYGGQPFTFPETCTAGAGFTQPAGLAGQTNPNGSLCAEYQLASAGGSVTATQTITTAPSPATWVYALLALKVGSATLTALGGVVNPDSHQIFFNADGATGHGMIDFTGNLADFKVLPEWWGASENATAAANTAALQAATWASYGCGPLACRSNGSGLGQYNKTLYLSKQFQISDELQWYHVLNFKLACAGRLNSGITQTGVNKRIIDGQSDAYGSISDCNFSGASSNTNALIDLGYNGTQGADLRPQFIDFYNDTFGGAGTTAYGVLIAKEGGGAQGSNINFYDPEFNSFTEAALQVGMPAALAQNALAISVYNGDFQFNPKYGFANYGGGFIQFWGTSFEDQGWFAGTPQTGADIFCSAPQGKTSIYDVRSESRNFVWCDLAEIYNSRNIEQAATPTPGSTQPVGAVITGNRVTGDGAHYQVTNNSSAFSGYGTTTAPVLASGGSSSTLVATNEVIAGVVNIGLLASGSSGETMTQASTLATGTRLSSPTSNATIAGTLTSGSLAFGDTGQQATTGVTCTIGAGNTATNLNCTNFSGVADNSHVWTDLTTSGTFTPSGAPVFAATTLVISAHSGSPDNTNDWVGATSGAHFKPTAVPAATGWTVNTFAGQLIGIWTGTNQNCFASVASNTANTVTITGNWATHYPYTICTAPDSTSTFIIEPTWNHGTVTSGGMTLAYMDEAVVRGSTTGIAMQGRIQDAYLAGGKVKIQSGSSAKTVVKNLTVTRADWYDTTGGATPGGAGTLDYDWDVNVLPLSAQTYINWALPAIGGTNYNNSLHESRGTKPMCWETGTIGIAPNTSANEMCIGGRSYSQVGTDAFLNRVELPTSGSVIPNIGPDIPTGLNLNGKVFRVSGGPPTGSGTPGNIEFWTSPGGGSSSTTAQTGASRGSVTPTGFQGPIGQTTPAAGSFTAVGASGQITSTVATGTPPLVIASTTQVANLNASQLQGATWAAPLPIGTTTPANGTFNNLTINGACTGCGGGGGSGTVTNIATTSPLSGGPITTTGTLTCPTCVVASSPGAGIAHFAGATQTVTSSGIVDADFAAGAVDIPHGGTNATTAAGALVKLLPAGTRIGDMLYCSAYSASACTTWSLVAGNTSSTAWLQQTASGVPSWTVPAGAGTVAVVGAGSLTSTALVTGGGTQLVQTPSATSTLDTSGNLSLAAGGSLKSADTGTPGFTFSTNTITANQKLTGTLFTGSTGFAITGATTAGHYLRNNGTNFVDSALLAGDIPSLSATYLPLSGGTLNGNLLFTDGSYDIGQPSTTRPRNLYVGGLSTSQVQAPVINATTGFQIGAAAPNGHFLTGTGTYYADNARLTDDGTTLSYSGSGGIAASSLSITSPFQIFSSIPAGAFAGLTGNSGFGVSNDGDWYLNNGVTNSTPSKVVTEAGLTFDKILNGTSTGDTFVVGTGSSLAPTSATVGSVVANRLIFGSTAIPTGTIPASGECLSYNGTNFTGAACSGGGGGTTTNPITFNNSGSGAASGTTFDGSVARTISYNTFGAAASTASVTFNGANVALGGSGNVESAPAGQVAISGGPGAALTGSADLLYNSGTHTFSTTAAGIFDLSASTATNGLIVPSFNGAIAASTGGVIIFDSGVGNNYHGFTAQENIFGVFSTAAVPATGNVIDMGGNATHFLLHDSGKATGDLVTATSAAGAANLVALSVGASKGLKYTAADSNTAHALFATGTAPAFRALLTTDLPTAIPLANLATIGADFAVVNNTGSTAVPSAIALGSCSSASNALTYNTTTHVFGCNTISGSGTVNSGTATHLAYYASTTTAVSDLGADITWTSGTHTFAGGASLVFDMSALTGATNVKFPSGVPLTSPTFTTPALGTPASGVLTNTTGLPAASIVAGTMAANMVIPTPSVTTQAIDCHVACSPTAAQLSNAIVANITGSTGQANSAVTITGPTVAAGMSFVMILGAAEGASATWTYTSNTANVYLDGGTVKTNIGFGNSAVIGSSISCFSFPISGAFALKCTTLAGTSTSS